MRDDDSSGLTAGYIPISTIERERTVVASRCVKMVAGGRVCQVVGRDVNRLYGRDRAALRRDDALLQVPQLVGQGRLVADGGGHAPQKGGDLVAGLDVAEDVVDKQKDVPVHLVTEILGHREARQTNAHARSGGFVHLAEGERRFIDGARFTHVVDELVAFAAALADTGEDGESTVHRGDVVDELHDQNCFSHAGAAEQADLSALGIRGDQIDDLDARLKELRDRGQLRKGRGRSVDIPFLCCFDGRAVVDGPPENVHDAAKDFLADRDLDAVACTRDGDTAGQSVCGIQRDAPDDARSNIGGDLHVAAVGGDQKVIDLRFALGVVKTHIQNRSADS